MYITYISGADASFKIYLLFNLIWFEKKNLWTYIHLLTQPLVYSKQMDKKLIIYRSNNINYLILLIST